MLNTAFAWDDHQVLVAVFDTDDVGATDVVARLRKEIGMRGDDPRWVVLGCLASFHRLDDYFMAKGARKRLETL